MASYGWESLAHVPFLYHSVGKKTMVMYLAFAQNNPKTLEGLGLMIFRLNILTTELQGD